MLKLLFSEFTRPFPRLTGHCMHNNHMIDQHVVVLTWEEVGFAEPILALITERGRRLSARSPKTPRKTAGQIGFRRNDTGIMLRDLAGCREPNRFRLAGDALEHAAEMSEPEWLANDEAVDGDAERQ